MNWAAIFRILGAATQSSVLVQTLWALITTPLGIVPEVVPSLALFSSTNFFNHIMTHKYQRIFGISFLPHKQNSNHRNKKKLQVTKI
jgi:hypothetical protein